MPVEGISLSGVSGTCNPPHIGARNQTPEEQQMLFAAESSLQLLKYVFKTGAMGHAVVALHLYFHKQSLPEDQKSKTTTLASLTDQAAITHL